MSKQINQANNTPIKTVYILGNGQLARMLKQAAEPLGITVNAIGLESEISLASLKNQLHEQTVITAEIERWPSNQLTDFLAKQPYFVNHSVFGQLADRYTQKKLIDSLNLNTAPWTLLPKSSEWPLLFGNLAPKLVIKTRTGGYDGRGQWRVTQENMNESLPQELVGEAIAESMIDFDYEISLVGARGYNGEKVFYPITHNYHQDGILRASLAFDAPLKDSISTSTINNLSSDGLSTGHPLKKNIPTLQDAAQTMLGKLLDELNYVGVLAMECFVVEGKNGPSLLINELAPRVHNSGHWTQNGSSISQFELHIRAICGLPLVQPTLYAPSVMINIIGTPLDYQWLNHSLVNLHWYDKEPRVGRKLGHLNISSNDSSAMQAAIESLLPNLPDEYINPIKWVKNSL